MSGHLLFWIVIVIWLVMEGYVFFRLNRETYDSNKEKKSKLIILGTILFGLFGSLLVDRSVLDAFNQPFQGFRYLGTVLILLGVTVRFTAIRQLGASFSVNVGVPEGTKLKQDGLYGLVRHPSYLGEIIIFLGLALVILHPAGSFFVFVFPTAAFLYRIHMEEKVLTAAFGEEYKQYQQQTKKVIPFIY